MWVRGASAMLNIKTKSLCFMERTMDKSEDANKEISSIPFLCPIEICETIPCSG